VLAAGAGCGLTAALLPVPRIAFTLSDEWPLVDAPADEFCRAVRRGAAGAMQLLEDSWLALAGTRRKEVLA
jgi:hypothetical protein